MRISAWSCSPPGQGRFARFLVNTAEGPLGPFELHVPGRHNVLNATAAVAIARQLEVAAQKIAEGSIISAAWTADSSFRGEARGVTVVDDYGHHPTEIQATLAAARECGHAQDPRRLPAPPVHAYRWICWTQFSGAFGTPTP